MAAVVVVVTVAVGVTVTVEVEVTVCCAAMTTAPAVEVGAAVELGSVVEQAPLDKKNPLKHPVAMEEDEQEAAPVMAQFRHVGNFDPVSKYWFPPQLETQVPVGPFNKKGEMQESATLTLAQVAALLGQVRQVGTLDPAVARYCPDPQAETHVPVGPFKRKGAIQLVDVVAEEQVAPLF